MDPNLWKKPLVGRLHKHQVERLNSAFSQLKQCVDGNYLALVKYLDKQPEKFYSTQVFNAFFDFLNDSLAKTPKRITSILNDTRLELNKALLILDRVNMEKWHDDLKPNLEYEFMLFCDANLNTSYLKLVDGVYFHFIYIVASFITLTVENRQQDWTYTTASKSYKKISHYFVNLIIILFAMESRTGVLPTGILRLFIKINTRIL